MAELKELPEAAPEKVRGQRDIGKQVKHYISRYESEKGYPATKEEKDFIESFFKIRWDGPVQLGRLSELFPKVMSHRRKFIMKSAVLKQQRKEAEVLKGKILNLKACRELPKEELDDYGITKADIESIPTLEKEYNRLVSLLTMDKEDKKEE